MVLGVADAIDQAVRQSRSRPWESIFPAERGRIQFAKKRFAFLANLLKIILNLLPGRCGGWRVLEVGCFGFDKWCYL